MKSVQRRGKRRVRKSVLVVGVVLLVAVGFLLVKSVAGIFAGSGPLAFTETTAYNINEEDKTEFYIDYTNNKKLNKAIEEEVVAVYEANKDLFDSKDKKVRAVLSINEDLDIASYVFTDHEGNVVDIYGTVNIDVKNKESIKSDSMYFEDLKGLSMLVRKELAKDNSLTYNQNTYLKTVPEASSFSLVTLEKEGVVFHFKKDTLNTEEVKSATLSYSDVMPYFSDELIKRIDNTYTREDVSTVRYIDPLKPMVAVTYDDGPKPSTTVPLGEYYSENNAKLTYFWLGQNIEKYKDVVKQMYDLGHEIANHSYDHKDFNSLSDEELKYQTEDMNKQIMDITNQSSVLIRAPYGAANKDTRAKITSPLIMWSIDTLDWQSRDADKVYDHIIENIQDGDIILMHDLYETSVEAGKRLLDTHKNNYQFVTVTELHQYKGMPLENGKFHYGASR